MILERVEKDGSVDVIYESSNIVASKYTRGKKDLNIIFKHGGSYTYQNVTESDYLRFELADSQGTELNERIKKYPFLKHENVNVEDILTKIKTLKADEVHSLAVDMVSIMNGITNHFDSTKSIDSVELDKLNRIIVLYNDLKNKK